MNKENSVGIMNVPAASYVNDAQRSFSWYANDGHAFGNMTDPEINGTGARGS